METLPLKQLLVRLPTCLKVSAPCRNLDKFAAWTLDGLGACRIRDEESLGLVGEPRDSHSHARALHLTDVDRVLHDHYVGHGLTDSPLDKLPPTHQKLDPSRKPESRLAFRGDAQAHGPSFPRRPARRVYPVQRDNRKGASVC